MNNCLPSLVASLPGIIIICGLIALFCIVLFDTTPARGQTRTVKFREPGKIEYGICNAIAKPNAPQEDVELDSDDLLFKVEKEISPDFNVGIISRGKKETLLLGDISAKWKKKF